MLYFWMILFTAICASFDIGSGFSQMHRAQENKIKVDTDSALNYLLVDGNSCINQLNNNQTDPTKCKINSNSNSNSNSIKFTPPSHVSIEKKYEQSKSTLTSSITMSNTYETIKKYPNNITVEQKKYSTSFNKSQTATP